jgi:hypothetical protein
VHGGRCASRINQHRPSSLELLSVQPSAAKQTVSVLSSSLTQAVLRRRYVQAALAACAAMAVRQNSAVWAAFSLGVRSYTLVKHMCCNCSDGLTVMLTNTMGCGLVSCVQRVEMAAVAASTTSFKTCNWQNSGERCIGAWHCAGTQQQFLNHGAGGSAAGDGAVRVPRGHRHPAASGAGALQRLAGDNRSMLAQHAALRLDTGPRFQARLQFRA